MAFRQQFGQESENVNFTPLKNASTFKFYKTKIPKTLSITKKIIYFPSTLMSTNKGVGAPNLIVSLTYVVSYIPFNP